MDVPVPAYATELAAATAAQLQALADGNIPHGQRFAQMCKIQDNVKTLMAWLGDDRPGDPVPAKPRRHSWVHQDQINRSKVCQHCRIHVQRFGIGRDSYYTWSFEDGRSGDTLGSHTMPACVPGGVA